MNSVLDPLSRPIFAEPPERKTFDNIVWIGFTLIAYVQALLSLVGVVLSILVAEWNYLFEFVWRGGFWILFLLTLRDCYQWIMNKLHEKVNG